MSQQSYYFFVSYQCSVKNGVGSGSLTMKFKTPSPTATQIRSLIKHSDEAENICITGFSQITKEQSKALNM